MKNNNEVRHVLGLSGGKDSAALALFLREKGLTPDNMEYYFLDTGCELPEVYAFLDRLEVYLDIEIVRLGSELSFEDHLKMQSKINTNENFLPSPFSRWCTKLMKIQPFEQYIGLDSAVSYIGIRADEMRDGYNVKGGKNITPVYPFKKHNIVRKDVFDILERTIGIPEYYKWRSRSGCYFCFYQRLDEWAGLYKHHPNLFNKAMTFEKSDQTSGRSYSWIEGKTLQELKTQIDSGEYSSPAEKFAKTMTWQERVIEEYEKDELDDQSCWVCSL